jgi:hypothetical protein
MKTFPVILFSSVHRNACTEKALELVRLEFHGNERLGWTIPPTGFARECDWLLNYFTGITECLSSSSSSNYMKSKQPL